MSAGAGEDRETRLRRLHMRSIRRGIREMDLILSDFASANLADMSEAELDLYEALLAENDHDLLSWITGNAPAPEPFAALIGRVAKGAVGITRA